MADFQHFLLTRFNVREVPGRTELVSDPGWLAHRFDLFEQFCLPSVAAQTARNFLWVLFLDEATPESFRDRIQRHARDFPNLRALYVIEHSRAVVADALSSLLHDSTAYVITSRLDNDDAVSRDYIERIQQAFDRQNAEVLNFPRGLVWHKGRVYLHADPSNAFATLVEKRRDSGLLTVCARPHPKLSQVAPVRQLDSRPAWLQAVHGTNRRNRVRGWRAPAETMRNAFAIAPSVAWVESRGFGYHVDRWVLSGLRQAREGAIRAAKKVKGG